MQNKVTDESGSLYGKSTLNNSFSELFKSSLDAFVVIENVSGDILMWNQSADSFLGLSVIPENLHNIYHISSHPSEIEKFLFEPHQKPFQHSFKIEGQTPSKRKVTLHPLEEEQAKYTALIIETNRPGHHCATDSVYDQRAESIAHPTEEILRNLTNAIPGAVYRYQRWEDGKDQFTIASDRFCELFNLPKSDIPPPAEVVFSQIHPDDIPILLLSVKESFEKLTPWEADFRVMVPNGSHTWVRGRSLPQGRNEDGSVTWNGLILDITQEKEHEQALKDSQRFLEETNNIARIGGWEIDLKTMIPYWSAEVRRIHEVEPDYVPQLDKAIEFYAPEARPIVEARIQECLETGQPWDFELPFITAKGNKLWVRAIGKPLYDEKGKIIKLFGIFQDITERHIMQEGQLRLTRMESLEQLAGGVAHDVNNYLGSILLNLSLARDACDEQNLEEIKTSLDRAAAVMNAAQNLSKQLLTFSKNVEPTQSTFNLEELTRETVDFSLRGSAIRFRFEFPREPMEVYADRIQIQQVISNLAINAKQACKNRGNFDVQGSFKDVDANNPHGLGVGPYAMVKLKDSGPGISSEALGKIFDPYYTTKSSGSGLGLASSYSILKQHNGALTCHSSEGEGAEFTIYLPVQKIPSSSAQNTDGTYGVNTRDKGMILILDDNEDVRSALSVAVQLIGHKAESFSTGQDCLEAFKKHQASGKSVDALILDLTIPGSWSGEKTLSHVKKIDPSVKAIACSGYTSSNTLAEHQKHGFTSVLKKPFTVSELESVLEDCLTP